MPARRRKPRQRRQPPKDAPPIFGTKMKGPYNKLPDSRPTVARIEEVDNFLNWSFLPILTPWGESSIFSRFGFHAKILVYFASGIGLFFWTDYAQKQDPTLATNPSSYLFGVHEISIANRIMTFVLSSYLILIVKTYHVGVRSKSRSMMYGASKAVDTLSMTIDYNHPAAEQFMNNAYIAMTVIGRYALIIASKGCRFKKSKKEIIDFFEERGLDGNHLASIPPKQTFHVLRLAILQAVREQRETSSADNDATGGGCFREMSEDDWVALRTQLNDYCAGASMTNNIQD